MKIISRLAITAFSAASGLATAQIKVPMDKLMEGAKKLEQGYRVWLAEKPRKLAIQFIETKDLPDSVTKLGFKSAAIETGLVILISTSEDADPIEGVAISTDGSDPTRLLEKFSWRVSDSDDSRIKLLKRTKAQQAGAGQPVTRSESKSEGSDKPQPKSEGRYQ